MTDRAQQLLCEFHRGHLGTAHGLAKVLVFLADNHGDPESWHAVPAGVLYDLAAGLTAELPAPYGNGEPPTGTPLRALEAAQAGIILNELQAARELADRVGQDPASITKLYLDALARHYGCDQQHP